MQLQRKNEIFRKMDGNGKEYSECDNPSPNVFSHLRILASTLVQYICHRTPVEARKQGRGEGYHKRGSGG